MKFYENKVNEKERKNERERERERESWTFYVHTLCVYTLFMINYLELLCSGTFH